MLSALGGCRDNPDEGANNVGLANNIVEQLPTPEPLLDRRGLLLALGDAASAYAAGSDDMEAQRALVGRRFAFRMAFGCPGSGAADKPLRLTIRDDGKSYEARARFSIDAKTASAFVPTQPDSRADAVDPAPTSIETVEGFWVERPWLLAEQCPKSIDPPAGSADNAETNEESTPVVPAPVAHVAGIAQFLTPTDSRVAIRGGRDYVKVVTLNEGEAPPAGLFLLVEGRLRAWPDGKAIECRDAPAGGRPTCLIGATIDRVAFERLDDRSVVAEWTNS